jgi:hypothetical protein
MQPTPVPFPGDIPDHPLRPWDPDDPDEEKNTLRHQPVILNHCLSHLPGVTDVCLSCDTASLAQLFNTRYTLVAYNMNIT